MPTDLPPVPPAPPSEENRTGPRAPAARDGSSFLLVQVGGIPIRVHWSFFLLVVWVALVNGSAGRPNEPILRVLFLLAIFACVALHELGHALVASRYKIRTREIMLFPLGGIAGLEQQPNPRQEFWIALAGPLVNLFIALALYLGLKTAGFSVTDLQARSTTIIFLTDIFWANIALAGFNLIPAFPMDGGRVLRSLMAGNLSLTRATSIASRISQVLAVLLGIFGVFSGMYLLILVAIFVYFGARQEESMVRAHALTEGHFVREAMMREFRTLTVGSTLQEAADALLAGSQQDFPIHHGSEIVGVLSRATLMRGLAQEGGNAYVAGVMDREFAVISPDDSMENLLPQVAALAGAPLLVMNQDENGSRELVGMITQENLIEFLMLSQIDKKE